MLIKHWLESLYTRFTFGGFGLRRRVVRKRRSRVYRQRAHSAVAAVELLEDRVLLAGAGPQVVQIVTNAGDIIAQNGTELDQSFRELTIQFSEGQVIDAGSLDAIQFKRSADLAGTFDDGDDQIITPGYIAIGDRPNEVIVRFAETLPDDRYRIEITGTGAFPLKNSFGQRFQDGSDFTATFDLDLGASVVAVVPQPITVSNGVWSQAKNRIDVYFNANDPVDPDDARNPAFYRVVSPEVGGGTILMPASVTFNEASNVASLVFENDLPGNVLNLHVGVTDEGNGTVVSSTKLGTLFDRGAEPSFSHHYFLGDATAGSALSSTEKDVYEFHVNGTSNLNVTVTPVAGLNVVVRLLDAGGLNVTAPVNVGGTGAAETLTFAAPAAGKYYVEVSSVGGTGSYRLDIDVDRPLVLDDNNSSFNTATNLNFLGAAGHSVSAQIEVQDLFVLLPPESGGDDEPGHRIVTPEDHLQFNQTGTAWQVPKDIPVIPYNFKSNYGINPITGQQLENVLTNNEALKQRFREIFDLFSYYAGVLFVETEDEGLQLVLGDMDVVGLGEPNLPADPGNTEYVIARPVVLPNGELNPDGGMLILDNSEFFNRDNGEYGGFFFSEAMEAVGQAIGLGGSFDLPSMMGDETLVPDVTPGTFDPFAGSRPIGEPVFPGDHDITHLRRLYPRHSTDIDLYKFEVTETGTFTAETIAQRLADTSLLDTTLILYNASGQVVARNDNFYSKDSRIELELTPGSYYIGVSAAGNENYDPTVSDTGFGGRSNGQYELNLKLTPPPRASIQDTDLTPTDLDGDADGNPGGEFVFSFRGNTAANTVYVDKSNPNVGDGTLANPYQSLGFAVANIGARSVVRVLGNDAGTPYILGRKDNFIDFLPNAEPNPDGSRMDNLVIPQNVTVMIDAGAVFKFSHANIEVGTSNELVSQAGAALQVLGVPGRDVLFTSWHDDTRGGNSNGVGRPVAAGDWGGLVFREDSDFDNIGQPGFLRDDLAEPVFLNYVNHATITYGGGSVVVNSQLDEYTPVHLFAYSRAEVNNRIAAANASDQQGISRGFGPRPTLSNNTIVLSAGAAISANPNNFNDSLGRLGPDVHGNTLALLDLNNTVDPLVTNSLNGLFIRIDTRTDGTTDKLEVGARFDDTDIVHIVTENLNVAGAPGGPITVGGVTTARLAGRLMVDPGVIVKVGAARIELERGGSNLIAEGTETDKVIFTSIKDDGFGGSGTNDTNGDAPDPIVDTITTPDQVVWNFSGPTAIFGGQVEGMTAQSSPVIGAVHVAVAHPTDPNVLWVGGVNGGVWRTTNATSGSPTWTPLTDILESLSIGSMDLDPTDPTHRTLVVGTGRYSSFGQLGAEMVGLYRTVNADAPQPTWINIDGGGVLQGKNISAVAARGNTIVVAVNTADSFSPGAVGIFRSTDGGATFRQVSSGNGTGASGLPFGVVYDMVGDPLDPDTLYAGVAFAGALGGGQSGIYKSIDGGATWLRVSSPEMEAMIAEGTLGETFVTSNIELSVGHDDADGDGRADNVYVGIIDDGELEGLFRSGNAGSSWDALDLPTTIEGDEEVGIQPEDEEEEDDIPAPGSPIQEIAGGQGVIHFSIVADPNNANIVYVGGDRQPIGEFDDDDDGTPDRFEFPNSIGANDFTGRLFRVDASKPAGEQATTLTHIGTDPANPSTLSNSAPHADSRDLVFRADGQLVETDDGGVYLRTNPQGTGDWFSLNGNLAVTEVHDVAYDSVLNRILAGTQDNGNIISRTGTTIFDLLTKGDGGDVAVDDYSTLQDGDATNDRVYYYTSAFDLLGFTRWEYDTAGTLISQTPIDSSFLVDPKFTTPIELNRNDGNRMIVGDKSNVYELFFTTDTDPDPNAAPGSDPRFRVQVQDLGAIGGVNENAIAYGGRASATRNDDVLYVGSGTEVFVRRTAADVLTPTAFPGGEVQDIVLDPQDWRTAYVIDSNSLWKTTDAGLTWTNITGALPGDNLQAMAYLPGQSDTIVLAGEDGVFVTEVANPGVWQKVGVNLPNAIAYDMEYDAADDALVVATMGRGVWTVAAASTVFGGGLSGGRVIRQPGAAPVPGDWSGLIFSATASGNLDHVRIAYGGGGSVTEGDSHEFNPVEIHQAEVRIANSDLRHNADGTGTAGNDVDREGRGENSPATIFVRGAQPIIINNEFRSNDGNTVSIDANSMKSLVQGDTGRTTGATYTDPEERVRFTAYSDNHGPLVRLNRIDSRDDSSQGIDATNGMEIRGTEVTAFADPDIRASVLTAETVWDDTDIVHVLRDEIVVSNHHTYSGLRLESSATSSLVVKLFGPTAGFTADGEGLDIDDRIGGTVQIVGAPGFPVVLTSLNDDKVSAGFRPDGTPNTDTNGDRVDASGTGGSLPSVGEIDNGTVIDNDAPVSTVGYFANDIGNGGAIDLFGSNGVTAQGNSQLFTNQNFIFDFINYVDVGPNGGGLNLANTTITSPATLVSPDVVRSSGTFTGDAGQLITWQVESRMDNSSNRLVNTITFTSAAPLGNLRFINYLDEDIQGPNDDILQLVGTPGQADFRAFTLDGPQRVGFSQGGIYTPGAGLVNATYSGFAADAFPQLQNIITGAGTSYTVAGNIDTVDLPPTGTTEFGPNDVTTAFAWTANPNANTATMTSFLELIPVDPGRPASDGADPAPGDWRSVKFNTFANDRNVQVAVEREAGAGAAAELESNNIPLLNAQFLGELATEDKAADENRRSGFEVHGFINPDRPTDEDVYRFRAKPGTEVWLDIDRTDSSLDTVIELIDITGQVLASSDDNRTFGITALGSSLGGHALPMLKDPRLGGDFYSTNPDDAGMRLILPGISTAVQDFFVRVKSAGTAAKKTGGEYQLQVRLRQPDEKAGSTVSFSDIRFATDGIEVHGLPKHSPIVAEHGETGLTGAETNDTYPNAQYVGNLLASDRNAISLAGIIPEDHDLDFYTFDVDYQAIDPNHHGFERFAVTIDLDFADALHGGERQLYLFDADTWSTGGQGVVGQLIARSTSSSQAEDLSAPLNGLDVDDLTRGSSGASDPFIGPVELSEGRYILVVATSSTNGLGTTTPHQSPQVMDQFTNPASIAASLRLRPVSSTDRVAEDHISDPGNTNNQGGETRQHFSELTRLFNNDDEDDPTDGQFSSLVPWFLGDTTLFVSQEAGNDRQRLIGVDPFTGYQKTEVDPATAQNAAYNDIAINMSTGELYAFEDPDTRYLPNPGHNDATRGHMLRIDPNTGVVLQDMGSNGISTFHPAGAPPGPAASNVGYIFNAITFSDDRANFDPNGNTGGRQNFPGSVGDVVFGIGNRSVPGSTDINNVLYSFTYGGQAISSPSVNRINGALINGAMTDVIERGILDTTQSVGGTNRLNTPAPGSVISAYVIDDAHFLTVIDTNLDAAGNVITDREVFEINFGPQFSFDNFSTAVGGAHYITDGDTFTLLLEATDPVTGQPIQDPNNPNVRLTRQQVIEFNTNEVITVARAGGGYAQDSGFSINGRRFEFNDSNNNAVNIAVAGNASRQTIATAIAAAINGVQGQPAGTATVNPLDTTRVTLQGDNSIVFDPGLEDLFGGASGVPGSETQRGLNAGSDPNTTVVVNVEETSTIDELIAAINTQVDANAAGNKFQVQAGAFRALAPDLLDAVPDSRVNFITNFLQTKADPLDPNNPADKDNPLAWNVISATANTTAKFRTGARAVIFTDHSPDPREGDIVPGNWRVNLLADMAPFVDPATGLPPGVSNVIASAIERASGSANSPLTGIAATPGGSPISGFVLVDAHPDNDVPYIWGVQPDVGINGRIVKIDPTNGNVVTSFAAPAGTLNAGDTNIGLSLAENGRVLLYTNHDSAPGVLFRLDPNTGNLLSAEIYDPAQPSNGLSYESYSSLDNVYYAMGNGGAGTGVHRQTGYSGGQTENFIGINPSGALGGDGYGREFAVFDNGGVAVLREYDPATGAQVGADRALPAGLAAAEVQGLAFDGRNIYLSTDSEQLLTLDADTGTLLQQVSVAGLGATSLYGLGAPRNDASPTGPAFGRFPETSEPPPSQPFEVVGTAPGGIITGAATRNGVLYVVTDTGGYFRVVSGTGGQFRTDTRNTPAPIGTNGPNGARLQLIHTFPFQFEGLTAGPETVEGSKYINTMVGINANGEVVAFDTTTGAAEPIFTGGNSSIQLRDENGNPLGGVTGLAFSNLNDNLWGVNGNNVPAAQRKTGGNTTLHFGTGVRDGNNTTIYEATQGSYEFAGGAHGTVETGWFSLENYARADQPTLYFDYFRDTDDGLDGMELSINTGDGVWTRLTPTLHNTNGERQARVDLSNYAGLPNLQMRFDFTTSGGHMNVGDRTTTGDELRAKDAVDLRDADTFSIDRYDVTLSANAFLENVPFEFDMDQTLVLPGGNRLKAGDAITVTDSTDPLAPVDTVFTFVDRPAQHSREIQFSAADTAQTIAEKVRLAIARFYGPAAAVNLGVGPEINRVNVFSTGDTNGDGTGDGLLSLAVNTPEIIIEGDIGVAVPDEQRIRVHNGMDRFEVARVMRQVIALRLVDDSVDGLALSQADQLNVFKLYRDVIRIIGHDVANPGPLGLTSNGDLRGTPSTFINGNRSSTSSPNNYFRPEQGQSNAAEGFYIDDVVIGFAERGEEVTGAPTLRQNGNAATFVRDHLDGAGNPFPTFSEFGQYQVEIRRATEYDVDAAEAGNPELNRAGVADFTVDVNDLQVNADISIVAPPGSDIFDGQKFRVSDGVRTRTFEFVEFESLVELDRRRSSTGDDVGEDTQSSTGNATNSQLFTVTNVTPNEVITQVEINLRTIPSSVGNFNWDNLRNTIVDAGSSNVGFAGSTVFDGGKRLLLTFNQFNPGERFLFGHDVDGATAIVTSLQLLGAEIIVRYADQTTFATRQQSYRFQAATQPVGRIIVRATPDRAIGQTYIAVNQGAVQNVIVPYLVGDSDFTVAAAIRDAINGVAAANSGSSAAPKLNVVAALDDGTGANTNSNPATGISQPSTARRVNIYGAVDFFQVDLNGNPLGFGNALGQEIQTSFDRTGGITGIVHRASSTPIGELISFTNDSPLGEQISTITLFTPDGLAFDTATPFLNVDPQATSDLVADSIGYTMSLPSGAELRDGQGIDVSIFGVTTRFEFDFGDGLSNGGNVAVLVSPMDSPKQIALALEAALRAQYPSLVVSRGYDRDGYIDQTHTATGYTLAMPLGQDVVDGTAVEVTVGGVARLFEFDSDNRLAFSGADRVVFNTAQTKAQVAAALAARINAVFGAQTSTAASGGFVTINQNGPALLVSVPGNDGGLENVVRLFGNGIPMFVEAPGFVQVVQNATSFTVEVPDDRNGPPFVRGGQILVDGTTVEVTLGGQTARFEFDRDGTLNDPAAVPVTYTTASFASQIAVALEAAIETEFGIDSRRVTVPVGGNQVTIRESFSLPTVVPFDGQTFQLTIAGVTKTFELDLGGLGTSTPGSVPVAYTAADTDAQIGAALRDAIVAEYAGAIDAAAIAVSSSGQLTINESTVSVTAPGNVLVAGAIDNTVAVMNFIDRTTGQSTFDAGETVRFEHDFFGGPPLGPELIGMRATIELLNPITGRTRTVEGVFREGTGGSYAEFMVESVPHLVATKLGDKNADRPQGRIIISQNQILDAENHGILIDAGPRGAGGNPALGVPIQFNTLNEANLAPGALVVNNVVANAGTVGIQVSGDAGAGTRSIRPFAHVMNNTVYGGETPQGTGILVTNNASPTLMNNVLVNLATGIDIDVSSDTPNPALNNGTVTLYNLYSNNTVNLRRSGAAVDLSNSPTEILTQPGDPSLFVDADNDNFYLQSWTGLSARTNPAVDSSQSNLGDRTSVTSVTQPLGIPASNIIVPVFDLYGQEREDESGTQNLGAGNFPFYDRGAIERNDFLGPVVDLVDPDDNGVQDTDPLDTAVTLINPPQGQRRFVLKFTDAGIDVHDPSVTADQFTLTLDGVAMVLGTDYLFTYNTNTNEATFDAVDGLFDFGSYVITVNNQAGGVRDRAGNLLQGNQNDGTVRYTVNLIPGKLSIDDAPAVVEGEDGTATATFTVTLDSPSAATVTVGWSAILDDRANRPADTLATPGSLPGTDADFAARIGSLTFNPGEVSKTITIPIFGDGLIEKDETFIVRLSNPRNATIADRDGIGTIRDDDPKFTFPLNQNDPQATEGQDLNFTVELTDNPKQTVKVDYFTRQIDPTDPASATEGADYDGVPTGTLTFVYDPVTDTMEMQKTITIGTNEDSIVEPTENFEVVLVNPRYVNANGTTTPFTNFKPGTGLARDVATGSILDNEPTIRIEDATVNESDGTMEFDVVVDGVITGDIQVQFFFNDVDPGATKSPVFPFTLADGTQDYSPETTTLTFTAADNNGSGTVTKKVRVRINDDTASEIVNGLAQETFQVQMQFVKGNVNDPDPAQPLDADAVGTILDNDTTQIRFDDLQVQVFETDDPAPGQPAQVVTATFNVTLANPPLAGGLPTGVVTVDYATTDGASPNKASSGSDYTEATGTLTWDFDADPNAPLTQQITVTILADNLREGLEQFLVNLSNATTTVSGGTVIITAPQATGIIRDDDSPTISIKDASLREGEFNEIVFQVTLSESGGSAVTVDWATEDGTAVAARPGVPGDFQSRTGTLTFPANVSGPQTLEIRIPVFIDAINEGAENFLIRLSNPNGAVFLEPGVTVTAVGEILDSGTSNLPSAELSQLRRNFGFHFAGTFSQNFLGRNEKWFQDRNNQWFYIEPDGHIYRWKDQNGNTQRITPANDPVDQDVWANPSRLFNAEIVFTQQELDILSDLRIDHGFHAAGSFSQNLYGKNEKWFQDRTGAWHTITTDGTIRKWNGVQGNIGTQVVASLTSFGGLIWDDPTQLFNAKFQLTDQERDGLEALRRANGFHAAGSFSENLFGFSEKWFQNRNGVWHTMTQDGTIRVWNGVQGQIGTVVVGTAPAAAWIEPALLFNAEFELTPAEVTQFSNLRRNNGFHAAGSFSQNLFGQNEKWFQDRSGAWFTITTNGTIRKWDGVNGSIGTQVVATVSPLVWDDPNLLFKAKVEFTPAEQTALTTLRNDNGFHFAVSYYQNSSGLGEKWFQDRNGAWFYIVREGQNSKIFRWRDQNGNPQLITTATPLPAVIWDDPNLLFNA